MSKLTKPQIRAHDEALRLLERGNLTHDEILFVYENYREDAEHINSKSGAYFTPIGLAREFNLHIPYIYERTIKIIDLCAGTGILSYAASLEGSSWSRCYSDITCVEINPDYVEIGRKLMPEATWICGDALDPALLKTLGHFDCAISNPPYGAVPSKHRKHYSTGSHEYMVIEAAAQIANEGVFLVPQMSAPFVYSGTNNHRWLSEGRARDFERKTGITLSFNKGIDTEQYKGEWHGVSPICEIVCCDFRERTGQLTLGLEALA